ncbi:hypothetical protein CXZ10_02390 [Pleomorphomonas diazotrophica]|uniref:PRC-barrel domain-containing protein n=1 Tax=Pleomorphomonas diazotrophica TaxID=1166257 RepID=A0A1I4R244_9HYPH|nr:PRC-barrel domain-containing protein [Pleomorphomonas diazotrophica]PKR90258.1 hypothetical protein CXZ10_02390 [Pleomorphomonas diazotrophica]SFM46349.1 Sporulation protein YlmC, PRC-barrel domain family [Pleomorphomonas diazotrophica]
MKTRLLSVLLLTAAFPLSAAAQDTTTSPGATPGATQTQPMDGTTATDPAVTPTTPTDSSVMASTETFVTVPETGAWRVSDLQGKAVYGSDGASIGEINDVLVSQDGSINAVIIGVGGFLGIGEKDVAVNMSALQLGPGDTQAQADAASRALPDATDATGATGATGTDSAATGMDGTGGAAGTAGATGDMTAANTNNGASIGDDGLPDRIILNVTRQELEQAPAFEGVRAQTQQP